MVIVTLFVKTNLETNCLVVKHSMVYSYNWVPFGSLNEKTRYMNINTYNKPKMVILGEKTMHNKVHYMRKFWKFKIQNNSAY